MSTGFGSYIFDGGCNLSGTWYDNTNTQVPSFNTTNNPPSSLANDIYYRTQQVGVYMINGTKGSSCFTYPIFCSLTNMENIGVPNDSDDAYMVYPGYGFTLYYGPNYTDFQSRNYINTTNVPQLYYLPKGGFNSYGTLVYRTDGTDTWYDANQTSSIKIYFYGTEIVGGTGIN